MRNYWFFLALAVLIVSFGHTQNVFATPAPPRVVINPHTQQCDEDFYWTDECGQAILPTGWEFYAGEKCPAGYGHVHLAAEWEIYPSELCCNLYGGNPKYCPSAIPRLSVPNQWLPWFGGLLILTGISLGSYRLLLKRKS